MFNKTKKMSCISVLKKRMNTDNPCVRGGNPVAKSLETGS